MGPTWLPTPPRATSSPAAPPASPASQEELDAAWAARRIAGYRPFGLTESESALVLPVLRDWVIRSLPAPPAAVDRRLSSGVRLLVWCQEQGIALRPETVLREATLERFLHDAMGSAPGSSRSTVRTTLRSLARALLARPDLVPPPSAHGTVRMKPPYSPAEAAGLLALAAAQPTAARATNVRALLLAGLGAGLDDRELNTARGCWVRADGPDVVVDVAGRRPRTVPVRSRYAAALLELASAAGDGWLLGGIDTDRGSRVGALSGALSGGSDLPALSAGRLRATWLLELLTAGVRVDAVCAAAGLADPRLLVDLFPLLPAQSAADVRAALTGRAGRR